MKQTMQSSDKNSNFLTFQISPSLSVGLFLFISLCLFLPFSSLSLSLYLFPSEMTTLPNTKKIFTGSNIKQPKKVDKHKSDHGLRTVIIKTTLGF